MLISDSTERQYSAESGIYTKKIQGAVYHAEIGILHVISAFFDTSVPQNAEITR